MAAMMPPPDPATATPLGPPTLGPPTLGAIEPHLREAATILAELASQVEALGARLCTDPAVIARHITELQVIDLIAQKQMHLAQLLLADCPHDAVEAMGVQAVKERLEQSLGDR